MVNTCSGSYFQQNMLIIVFTSDIFGIVGGSQGQNSSSLMKIKFAINDRRLGGRERFEPVYRHSVLLQRDTFI